jgi:hypothetical protein
MRQAANIMVETVCFVPGKHALGFMVGLLVVAPAMVARGNIVKL